MDFPPSNAPVRTVSAPAAGAGLSQLSMRPEFVRSSLQTRLGRLQTPLDLQPKHLGLLSKHLGRLQMHLGRLQMHLRLAQQQLSGLQILQKRLPALQQAQQSPSPAGAISAAGTPPS